MSFQRNPHKRMGRDDMHFDPHVPTRPDSKTKATIGDVPILLANMFGLLAMARVTQEPKRAMIDSIRACWYSLSGGRIMFNLKNKLLKTPESDSVSQEQEEFERIQIATCIILLEVAKSDDEFSSIEKTTVSAILKRKFKLSAEAAEELMEIAGRKREDSIDIWEFTHLVNKNYSREKKSKIVEAAWQIIYSDEKLDKYEDHFVHKLAKLLQLDHDDLIEAKLKIKYKDKDS